MLAKVGTKSIASTFYEMVITYSGIAYLPFFAFNAKLLVFSLVSGQC